MNKDLLFEMLNGGMSMNDISKKESKSPTTIRYWCKKYGERIDENGYKLDDL